MERVAEHGKLPLRLRRGLPADLDVLLHGEQVEAGPGVVLGGAAPR